MPANARNARQIPPARAMRGRRGRFRAIFVRRAREMPVCGEPRCGFPLGEVELENGEQVHYGCQLPAASRSLAAGLDRRRGQPVNALQGVQVAHTSSAYQAATRPRHSPTPVLDAWTSPRPPQSSITSSTTESPAAQPPTVAGSATPRGSAGGRHLASCAASATAARLQGTAVTGSAIGGNRQLAARARDLAARARDLAARAGNPTGRRAALCLAVALDTTTTTTAARKVLDDITTMPSAKQQSGCSPPPPQRRTRDHPRHRQPAPRPGPSASPPPTAPAARTAAPSPSAKPENHQTTRPRLATPDCGRAREWWPAKK